MDVPKCFEITVVMLVYIYSLLIPQIEPQANSCQYPLINYLVVVVVEIVVVVVFAEPPGTGGGGG